ncbi:MAG: spore cortex biosynthesis protein YabQ [Oscillospiraceae bacterium]|nr:spore cortex biosynthesis protein YabQ [Oscillospiraceae bacterium]
MMEAIGALGMGVLLGVFYDFLRCARREFSSCLFSTVCDVLYAIWTAAALFIYGLNSPSGSLTLYIAVLSLSGAMLYFATLGKYMRRLFAPVMHVLRQILRKVKKMLMKAFAVRKKIQKSVKNIFSRAKKWFTITSKVMDCENPNQGRKGQRSEIQENRLSHESSYRGPDYLRSSQHSIDPFADIAG